LTSKYYNAKDMGHASRFCRQTLSAKSYWEILNNNSYSLKDKFIHQVVHTSGSLRKRDKVKKYFFFWENFAKKRFIIGRDRLKRELQTNGKYFLQQNYFQDLFSWFTLFISFFCTDFKYKNQIVWKIIYLKNKLILILKYSIL